jgi:hypothetical protein
LSNEKEINEIKEVAISSIDPEEHKQAINALSGYGNEGIIPITEIIDQSLDEEVRLHGYKTIERIKTLHV